VTLGEAIVNNEALFARVYRDQYGEQHLAAAGKYTQDVIDCTTDICNYIYDTHGRLPAHAEAIDVPGIWLQMHHVEERYYEQFFGDGLTEMHLRHDTTWQRVS
jgi:hypothetical protein